MGFLSPWFLAGAAAVGLPVWLHLLRKHKTTPLPFSSLMFFERRIQSSIKHRRLRYLLLFALREDSIPYELDPITLETLGLPAFKSHLRSFA